MISKQQFNEFWERAAKDIIKNKPKKKKKDNKENSSDCNKRK